MKAIRPPISINSVEQEVLADCIKDFQCALDKPKDRDANAVAKGSLAVMANLLHLNELVAIHRSAK